MISRLRSRILILAAAAGAAALTGATTTGAATLTQASTPTIGGNLLVGVRTLDMAQAQRTLGPVKVTRHYYNNLPSTYHTRYPGVFEIVSFLHSSAANTAHFVKSVSAGAPIVLVYHHEPEGTHADYSGTPQQAGARFVSEFDAQAKVIHANSQVPVGFIGGGYQYGVKNGRGRGGYFIPTAADYYFEDTYEQNSQLAPATQDPEVSNFLAELHKKGKRFGGFAEYARGTTSANPSARVNVLKADNTWLRSVGAKVWIYWWEPSKRTSDNWKFGDSASISEWRSIASQ